MPSGTIRALEHGRLQVQHAFGQAQRFNAALRQCEIGPAAIDKRLADEALQRANTCRDGRLGDVQPVCDALIGLQLAQPIKGFDMFEVH